MKISGECGPGRACVYNPFIEASGVCKTEAEADRIVAESKERQRDWELDRKLDDIKDKTDRLDRKLRWGY